MDNDIICKQLSRSDKDMNVRNPDVPSMSSIEGYHKITVTYLKELQTQVTRLGMDMNGYRNGDPTLNPHKIKYHTAEWWFPKEEVANNYVKLVDDLHSLFRESYCCNQDVVDCNTRCSNVAIQSLFSSTS
jgi:hypothetical protein